VGVKLSTAEDFNKAVLSYFIVYRIRYRDVYIRRLDNMPIDLNFGKFRGSLTINEMI